MLNKNSSVSKEHIKGPEFSGPFLYASPEQIKKYTCWIEIDRTKFFNNICWLKKLIGPHVGIAAVLKSNAYGHGLEHVATLCEESTDVKYLTVFLLTDALKLRLMGIKKPIVVLGGYDTTVDEAIINNIDLVAHDWESVHLLHTSARTVKKNLNVHLKIDTGLTRLGFTPNEIPAVIDFLAANPFINIIGAYTHFAESDSQDTSFTTIQISRFKETIEYLRTQRNLSLPFVHAANTAAALRFEEARWNLIRCGGALYGSYKDERFYQQVAEKIPGFTLVTNFTLKARIMALKDIPVGTPIGYARTFIAQHPIKLAIVSVGYYNDYDRRLSNKGNMVIHNTLVPIVGRVGMNMTTIDITHVPQARIGDEVMVIGPHDGVRLKDMARIMNVPEYEVMPPLTPVIPRVIV